MFPNLGEFNLIQKILEKKVPLIKESPHIKKWLSVGDDCAIFDGWLATKDMSVENVHFRLDWSTPEQAVEKHIISNVSDISSMGGKPRLAFFGLCINKNWDESICNRIVKAVSTGFAKRGITLMGGDTVSSSIGMFSTTLIGELVTDTALLRKSASPNDKIYVAGTLGKSAAGLWILLNRPQDVKKFSELVEYHLEPKIKENMGECLVNAGVKGACIDISDGLSSELNHLSLSSCVKFKIDEYSIPIDKEVIKMADYYGLNALDFAMNGGEEYELLFTHSFKNDIFQKNISCIGTVSKGNGVYMKCKNGEIVLIKAQAWSHL